MKKVWIASGTHTLALWIFASGLGAQSLKDLRVYWGDIHCHTQYSECPASSANTAFPADAFTFARDSVLLDFAAVTDHAEDMSDSEWTDIQYQGDRFNQAGVFVTLVAYEYTLSGLVAGGGHKNVYFADSRVPPHPFGADRAADAQALWDSLAAYDCITIPHHPAKGNNGHFTPSAMGTDWTYVNAEMQPLVEIYQSQGNSEVQGCEEPVNDFQAQRSVEAVLKRWLLTHAPGYKLGILASTDDHLGKPGSVFENASDVDTAEGFSSGGLVAVLAAEKTRENIFQAIRDRRTYATSGPRIGLEFLAVAGGDTFLMGETVHGSSEIPLTLKIRASGDGEEIDRILLIKNGETLAETDADSLIVDDVTDSWSYYRVKVFQKPTLRWDGVLFPERAWSSPIFIETGTTRAPGRRVEDSLSEERISCFPNPCNSELCIAFSLDRAGKVRLTLYDVLGRRVRVLVSENREAGSHSIRASAAGLTAGVYVVAMETPSGTAFRKIVLTP